METRKAPDTDRPSSRVSSRYLEHSRGCNLGRNSTSAPKTHGCRRAPINDTWFAVGPGLKYPAVAAGIRLVRTRLQHDVSLGIPA
jgi:hypothetical protein